MNGLGRYLLPFGFFVLLTAAAYLNTQSVALAEPLTAGLMLSLILFTGLLLLDIFILAASALGSLLRPQKPHF